MNQLPEPCRDGLYRWPMNYLLAAIKHEEAAMSQQKSDFVASPALTSITDIPAGAFNDMASRAATLREPKVSLGRCVHYVLPSDSPQRGAHRAATISQVHSDVTATLTVNKAQPDDFVSLHSRAYPSAKIPTPGCVAGHDCGAPVALVAMVCYDPDKRPGTWHWPERE